MTDPTVEEHPPARHRAGFDPELIAKKRATLLKLTVAAIIPAMVVSGWGMWTFFDDTTGLPWYLILFMFLLFDLAAIACAWGARISRIVDGRMGIQGWLVWVFAIASGLMSSSDSHGRESAVRFAAPMVAAILFELLIRGERRDITNHDSPLDRIRRRLMARAGLLDDVDQDDETAAMTRMAAKLATLAYRAHEPQSGRGRRRAVRRYHRRLRIATERMGFATNADMIDEVRLHLDALYSSMTGTSAEAVAGLNVWQTEAAPEPAAELEVAAFAQVAAPDMPRPVRIAPVRRPQRTGRLAGRARTAKAAQTAVRAPLAAVPASGAAALNGNRQPTATVQIPADASFAEAAQGIHAAWEAAAPPPEPAKKPSRRNARKQQSSKDKNQEFQDVMRFWESEKRAGRTPSGQDIANHIGKSRATGNRYRSNLNGVPS